MIELGSRVKDRITGIVGIAVSQTDWLFQCRRIGIQPEKLKEDGSPLDIVWVDEPQVEVIAAGVIKAERPTKATLTKTGGPARAVPPTRDPPR